MEGSRRRRRRKHTNSNTGSRKLDPENEVQPKEMRVATEFSQRKTLKHAARINIRSISVNRMIKEEGVKETQRGGADDVMQLEGVREVRV